MNDAMPQWRSFSSDAPVPPGEAAPPPNPVPGRPGNRWLITALAALLGLAASAACIGVLVLLLTVPSTADPMGQIGDPLEAGGAASVMTEASSPVPLTRIVVDVAGAVARPGLHRLSPGDRVGDAIAAAGGFAPRADLTAATRELNLAQPLADGMKVLVPELGIDRETGPGGRADDGRIDLNHADQAELESLPGIGPVTAAKILAARGERRFESVQDLRTRGLVGEKVFGDIRSLVHAG